MSATPIDIFLAAAASSGASIIDAPRRVVVFGGAVSTSAEIAAGSPPKSLRDAFIRWVSKSRTDLSPQLLVPENYADWSSFNTYSDLLKFEEDLGYVTSAVVIFLESSGAIAELGAFSQISTLKQQLVVVVHDKYHPKQSFISLGPLKQLEVDGKSSVCVIPERPVANFEEDIDIILQPIDDRLRGNSSGRTLVPAEPQHQIVLTLDLITLLEVATFTEIRAGLTHYCIDAHDGRLRQILYTLVNARLIANKRYGGIDYYYPIQRGKTWVDHIGQASSGPFNRTRIAARIAAARGAATPAAKAHAIVFAGSSS